MLVPFSCAGGEDVGLGGYQHTQGPSHSSEILGHGVARPTIPLVLGTK